MAYEGLQILFPPWVTYIVVGAIVLFVIRIIYRILKAQNRFGMGKLIRRLMQPKWRKRIKEAPNLADALNILCSDDKDSLEILDMVSRQLEAEVKAKEFKSKEKEKEKEKC